MRHKFLLFCLDIAVAAETRCEPDVDVNSRGLFSMFEYSISGLG